MPESSHICTAAPPLSRRATSPLWQVALTVTASAGASWRSLTTGALLRLAHAGTRRGLSGTGTLSPSSVPPGREAGPRPTLPPGRALCAPPRLGRVPWGWLVGLSLRTVSAKRFLAEAGRGEARRRGAPRPVARLLSLAFLGLALASLAPLPAQADIKRGTKVIDCYCTGTRGERHELGDIICLHVDSRDFTAQCQMSLNVPMWRELNEGCANARLTPRQTTPDLAPGFTPVPRRG